MPIENLNKLKVVFSHDWLTGMRGGERVLEVLCAIFPQAPIYTLFCNQKAISEIIKNRPIKTSFLQYLPGIFNYYRNLLPLFPFAIRSFRSPPADIIISLSHCVAKAFPSGNKPHLCYCFTPMRYAWLFYNEYFTDAPLKAILAKPLMAMIRKWDFFTAQQVTKFVAISKTVAERILKFYHIKADIIYPPIDTQFYTPNPSQNNGNFDLIVSALVPYKKIDLAVRAYAKYGYPLKIVGTGTEYKKLVKMASSNIEIMGWRSNEEIRELYRSCRLLVFPGEEDFGIVPLEAQSCGKPVVAYAKGGLLETVIDGETGIFFHEPTPSSLIEAVKICASQKFDPAILHSHAEKFGKDRFIKEFSECLCKCAELK